jgi:rhodanese-related sulfurtransferase
MRRWPRWQWTLKSRLAVLALALGLVAPLGSPRDGGRVTLNAAELAAIVESEVDHVTVDELAGWIIQGRNDYRLLDVRGPASYAEYHIPTAESVQLTDLADYPLFRNEKIVLYSDGGTHSAQGWFLLKARGYGGAYILLYGLEEWKEHILFPSLAPTASLREVAAFERSRRVSLFFGGTPRSGGLPVEQAAVAMPRPPAPTSAPVVSRKRKRKEGC